MAVMGGKTASSDAALHQKADKLMEKVKKQKMDKKQQDLQKKQKKKMGKIALSTKLPKAKAFKKPDKMKTAMGKTSKGVAAEGGPFEDRKLKRKSPDTDNATEKPSKKQKLPAEKKAAPGGKEDRPQLHELKKKERKVVRQQHTNKNYDLAVQAKKIWEELRKQDVSDAEKQKLCAQLWKMIKGKSPELIFAHDTVRVIECLEKYGSATYRNALFEELKDMIVPMAKSKYAKFFVEKLIKYGTKVQRKAIFHSFSGQAGQRQGDGAAKTSSTICDKALAVVVQGYKIRVGQIRGSLPSRNGRKRGGKQTVFPEHLFFRTQNAMEMKSQVRSIKIFAAREGSPNKEGRRSTPAFKENLLKPNEKNVLQHSIVHRVFLDFFTHAADYAPRSEVIEALRDTVVHMVHTREGAKVAMHCVWHGTAKDRKHILKSLKTHVVRVCVEEHAHLVLLALCDVVDDTKLMQKLVLSEMIRSLKETAFNPYGRKVLLYLLSRRDPLYFHPDVVKLLQDGDNNNTSKKDQALRENELREGVSAPALKLIADNAEEMVKEKSLCFLVLTILNHAVGDVRPALEAIVDLCQRPFQTGKSAESFHIVEQASGHLVVKRLIQSDKERIEKGQPSFCEMLLESLPEGCLKSWVSCNRGSFIVVALLETEIPSVVEKVKKELTGCKNMLGKSSFKGAEILLAKLK
ncbi:PREDICTED: pumilio domain-containing protein KIAA0020 homolog [Priapulus caudatus]|uniref:Pumilio domain-containing protein KIAA0020 homolog n=1 Tax=Priapulus caudatus TaxID=37621 RepID=A0ABM1EMN3_PRICU|nr:PREDICTED: pumilio domain-containing protein KIAA0020 homolog [Priapulus caudatus]